MQIPCSHWAESCRLSLCRAYVEAEPPRARESREDSQGQMQCWQYGEAEAGAALGTAGRLLQWQ